MKISLYKQIRKRAKLKKAWQVIRENGTSSKSETTRKEIKEFSTNEDRYLRRIEDQLRREKFIFLPSTGILQKKPGKSSKRPIVRSPIENRIVQRSILDVLQSNESVREYVHVPTSFGGIEKRGVPSALEAAHNAIKNDSKYFIRSDIESFFTKIPKPTIMEMVSEVIGEPKFIDIFKSAIFVELENLAQLGANRELFPIYDIGVAQGSCLSPLLGNLLLNEFDTEMNKGDIVCLRYIDDFIILAPDKKAAYAAFKRAQKNLGKHGLRAYDPHSNKDKAEQGEIDKGFTFLGCDVRPDIIRPNKKSVRRLKDSIKKLFDSSLLGMRNVEKLKKNHQTFIETLMSANNIISGWGNQYSFCNDRKLLSQIDESIDGMISEYFGGYIAHKRKLGEKNVNQNKRRLLGVHLLTDSKNSPIIG